MGRPTHETVMDRVIREAMERGAFDDLPHRGRPLPPRDERAGEWTTAFEMLRHAGIAPPWIEADKEARRHLDERDRLLERATAAGPIARDTVRRRFRDAVIAANRAIAELNALAPSLRVHRLPLDRDRELAELEKRFPPR
jgi:hypothetical protein